MIQNKFKVKERDFRTFPNESWIYLVRTIETRYDRRHIACEKQDTSAAKKNNKAE